MLYSSRNKYITKNMPRMYILIILNRYSQLWFFTWAFQKFTGLIIPSKLKVQNQNQWSSPHNWFLFPRIHSLMVIPLFFQVPLLNILNSSFKTLLSLPHLFTHLFIHVSSTSVLHHGHTCSVCSLCLASFCLWAFPALGSLLYFFPPLTILTKHPVSDLRSTPV